MNKRLNDLKDIFSLILSVSGFVLVLVVLMMEKDLSNAVLFERCAFLFLFAFFTYIVGKKFFVRKKLSK